MSILNGQVYSQTSNNIRIRCDWSTTASAITTTTASVTIKFYIDCNGSVVATKDIVATISPKTSSHTTGGGTISYPDNLNTPCRSTLDGGVVNFGLNTSSSETFDFTISVGGKVSLDGGETYITLSPKDVPTDVSFKTEKTRCGAPTSITATGTSNSTQYIVPGGTMKVVVSGGTAGTNCHMTGYNIYYAVNATPNTGSIKYATTSGTVNIPLPISVVRGATVNFGAKTTTDSTSETKITPELLASDMFVSGSLKVNTLPGAPTIAVNKTRVPTHGGDVTITTRTPGQDPDTGQTLTIYYYTNLSSEKHLLNSNTLHISNTSTYYFVTYDGFEYSNEVTAINFIAQTEPRLSLGTMTTENYNLVTTQYQRGLSNVHVRVNLDGTLKIYILFAGQEIEYRTETISGIEDNEDTTVSISNIYVDVGLAAFTSLRSATEATSWQIKFVFLNAINEQVSATTSGSYRLGPLITSVDSSYNRFNDSNIPGTTSGHFGNQARFKIKHDECFDFSQVKVTGSSSGTIPIEGDVVKTTTSGIDTFDVQLAVFPHFNEEVTFSFIYQDNEGNFTHIINHTLTECKEIILKTFTIDKLEIKPFTDDETGDYQLEIAWPFTSETIAAANTEYECNITDDLKLYFEYEDNDPIQLPITNISKSGNKLIFRTNKANFIGECFNDNVEWSHNYIEYLQLQITNLYGVIFKSAKTKININFLEECPSVELLDVTTTVDNVEYSNNVDEFLVQEGLTLKFNVQFELYTKEQVRVYLKVDRNGNGQFSEVKYETVLKGRGNYGTGHLSPGLNKMTIEYEIGEIVTDKDRTWRIEVQTSSGTKGTDEQITQHVVKQCAPDIDVKSFHFSIDNQRQYSFDYDINIKDLGLNSDISEEGVELQIEKSPPPETSPLFGTIVVHETSQISGQFESSVEESTIQYANLKAISKPIGYGTIEPLLMITRTYDLYKVIIEQNLPTIAYREHQLGFNSNNPRSTAVLEMQNFSNKGKIYLIGNQTDGFDVVNTIMTIDFPNGLITWESGVQHPLELLDSNGDRLLTLDQERLLLNQLEPMGIKNTHKYIDFVNGEIHGFVLR